MEFEINVAKDGKHFFATARRSAQTPWQAHALYKELLAKFPESEGYTLECTGWKTVGSRFRLEELEG